jgi:hypothetical protein
VQYVRNDSSKNFPQHTRQKIGSLTFLAIAVLHTFFTMTTDTSEIANAMTNELKSFISKHVEAEKVKMTEMFKGQVLHYSKRLREEKVVNEELRKKVKRLDGACVAMKDILSQALVRPAEAISTPKSTYHRPSTESNLNASATSAATSGKTDWSESESDTSEIDLLPYNPPSPKRKVTPDKQVHKVWTSKYSTEQKKHILAVNRQNRKVVDFERTTPLSFYETTESDEEFLRRNA